MKTILITGASSGIGKETAKFFQGKGWNVIATMRNPGMETELNQLDNVLITKLDVLDFSTIEAAVNLGITKFGNIDVLLNNAGYGAYGPLESFSREQVVRQFDTNVIGLLDVTKALLPHFRKQNSGTIINISSLGGKAGFPLGALYHGTKFAVEGISEALSYEVSQFGGKVKIIQPGAIATDFVSRSIVMSNDESMTEYQPLLGKVMTAVQTMFEQASPASAVAEVIYSAATDNSDQLRYTVGDDAQALIAARQQYDDTSFLQGVKQQFGL